MTLRWGFLGASGIGGRALAPAVLAASGHELHAIGARDLARAREFAAQHGIPRACGSYQEIIDDPAVDVVYIALPNDAHLPWTIAALDAGKHVLCEKPLALSAAEVRRMQAAESRSGRRVMEAFCHIFHPQMARVREMLGAGAIGPLVSMEACFGNPRDYDDSFRWMASHGGGALYDLGCYGVSALRVLTGREPVRAAAVQAVHADVDETLDGLLDFGDGVAGHIACSYVAARRQQVTLVGKRGIITLDWPYSTKGRTAHIACGDRTEEFAVIDPYVLMVEQFGRAIRGEAELTYGLAWSLQQALVLDALFAAARTGMTVSVSR